MNVRRLAIVGNRGKRRAFWSACLTCGIIPEEGTPTLVSNELGHIFGGRISHDSAKRKRVLIYHGPAGNLTLLGGQKRSLTKFFGLQNTWGPYDAAWCMKNVGLPMGFGVQKRIVSALRILETEGSQVMSRGSSYGKQPDTA